MRRGHPERCPRFNKRKGLSNWTSRELSVRPRPDTFSLVHSMILEDSLISCQLLSPPQNWACARSVALPAWSDSAWRTVVFEVAQLDGGGQAAFLLRQHFKETTMASSQNSLFQHDKSSSIRYIIYTKCMGAVPPHLF